jgi:hypothetical protein
MVTGSISCNLVLHAMAQCAKKGVGSNSFNYCTCQLNILCICISCHWVLIICTNLVSCTLKVQGN